MPARRFRLQSLRLGLHPASASRIFSGPRAAERLPFAIGETVMESRGSVTRSIWSSGLRARLAALRTIEHKPEIKVRDVIEGEVAAAPIGAYHGGARKASCRALAGCSSRWPGRRWLESGCIDGRPTGRARPECHRGRRPPHYQPTFVRVPTWADTENRNRPSVL
jgi:hypothetical protein